MKTEEITKLQQLTRLIETQLDWGDGENWTNRDFETLSERIFEKTAKQISITTLKRLWGRAKLTANPSISTLDILAEFADFENWRAFRKQEEIKLKPSDKRKSTAPVPLWGMLGVSLLVVGMLGTLILQSGKAAGEPTSTMLSPKQEDIEFEFEKVSIGYPNTVIFRYDVGDASYDSIEIQQSWDRGKRISLDQPKGLATTTYYYAGYYATKLIINDQIIAEKDLYIPTDGWQSFIGGNVPQLIYVKPEELIQSQQIQVRPSVLDEMNLYPQTRLWLSNLLPKPSIDSEHFDLESEFRLSYPTDKSICQNMWVVITGTKDVLRFQLSIPGCVGDLMFFLNMDMISGKEHDLSAFGVAATEWNSFKVKNRHNQLFVSINDEPVFAHELSDDIGQIGGVQFIFEGLGEVRSLHLYDKENSIDLIKSQL